MTRSVQSLFAWALLAVLCLAGPVLGAEAVGEPGLDDVLVVSAELAQRALAQARRFVDVTYEAGGASQRGVAYLLGGRMSVDEYLNAVATGKTPGVEAGADASAVVVQAYRGADPSFRFMTRSGGQNRLVPDATSATLYRWNVRTIPVEELRPGDLIFFKNANGDVAGVGIFERREGPNVHYIVASSNAGKVIRTFNNVNNDYWKTRFLAAGQMLWFSQ